MTHSSHGRAVPCRASSRATRACPTRPLFSFLLIKSRFTWGKCHEWHHVELPLFWEPTTLGTNVTVSPRKNPFLRGCRLLATRAPAASARELSRAARAHTHARHRIVQASLAIPPASHERPHSSSPTRTRRETQTFSGNRVPAPELRARGRMPLGFILPGSTAQDASFAPRTARPCPKRLPPHCVIACLSRQTCSPSRCLAVINQPNHY